mmetsp:Transcript_33243/g.48845  ORF Transcript_33243/g.48845 Transcript_33243/m.48845 type:complete len:91 (-) Transcript_33243:788-1060(-)
MNVFNNANHSSSFLWFVSDAISCSESVKSCGVSSSTYRSPFRGNMRQRKICISPKTTPITFGTKMISFLIPIPYADQKRLHNEFITIVRI